MHLISVIGNNLAAGGGSAHPNVDASQDYRLALSAGRQLIGGSHYSSPNSTHDCRLVGWPARRPLSLYGFVIIFAIARAAFCLIAFTRSSGPFLPRSLSTDNLLSIANQW